MNLGIQPSDGNYDIQPGQLSETNNCDYLLDNGQSGPAGHYLITVVAFTIRDIEQNGRNARKIDSYEDAIDGEQVIALKTSDPKVIGMRDYHYAILLPDGTWADKQGTQSDSRQGAIEDPDEPWGEWWKRYDSETYYFAISQPFVQ